MSKTATSFDLSFFVVGVQKGGTTTLHDLLMREPSISLPKIKETHYFCNMRDSSDNLGEYSRYFDEAAKDKILGEVDPDYAFFLSTPARLHTLFPKAKIVFLLREPIARAYSHYCMSFRRGLENLSFPDALRAEPERLRSGIQSLKHHSYAARGVYEEQVDRYINVFGREKVKLFVFEDFFGQSVSLENYRSLCDFIDVKTIKTSDEINLRSNESTGAHVLAVNRFIYKANPLKKILRVLVPSDNLRRKMVVRLEQLNKSPLAQKKDRYAEIKSKHDLRVPKSNIDQAWKTCLLMEKEYGLAVESWKKRLNTYVTI